jgi:hypothetical protein
VTLLDAMLFDKPLVIAAESGMRELAGDAAVVVEQPAPEAIATALQAALHDTALAGRLATARRQRLAAVRPLADGRRILAAAAAAREARACPAESGRRGA